MAGCFCVFVYVIVYNYVNVCISHNNKPFTTTIYIYTCIHKRRNPHKQNAVEQYIDQKNVRKIATYIQYRKIYTSIRVRLVSESITNR